MTDHKRDIAKHFADTAGNPANCGCDPDTGCAPCMNCALEDLAKAWLAEHPDDEGEPITPEWLLSAGAIRWKTNSFAFLSRGLRLRMFFREHYERWVVFADQDESDVVLGNPKTRGDIRRLCKALEVECKG